jgi:hypothetical protein
MVFASTLAVLGGKLSERLGLEGRTGGISILIIEATILEQIDVFGHF